MRALASLVAVVLAVAVGACGSDAPSPPDLSAVAQFCRDSDPPLAPTFDNVTHLFTTFCTRCHDGTDVDLTPTHAAATLIRRAVPFYQDTDESCGGLLVVPGDAGVSYLVHKLGDPCPCAGAQMPRGEFASAALPQCAQRLVIDWINAGAPTQ